MKRSLRGRRASAGFTLVELMVVIAILVILAGVVVPSFSDMVVRNSVSTHTNKMISVLRYARSEAISRQAKLAVCYLDENIKKEKGEDSCGEKFRHIIVLEKPDGERGILLESIPIPDSVKLPEQLNLQFKPDGSLSEPIPSADGGTGLVEIKIEGSSEHADAQILISQTGMVISL